MVHIAARTQLRAEGWRLVAGQYPGGSDDELSALNIVDPTVARDQSPDPRRHSLGKLVPDVVAIRHSVLLIVEAKVGYSDEDRLKLRDLVGVRLDDLHRALRGFGRIKGIPELLAPELLAIVPCLAFAKGTPPAEGFDGFAFLRARTLTTADLTMPA
jgi:hypothetical protein